MLVGIALLGGCSDDPAKKIAALRDTARSPSPGRKAKIEAAFSDRDRDVRATALILLSELDPERARPLALSALDDPDGVVRAAAVRVLAGRLDAEVASRLAALGPQDPVWQVRNAVLEAIAAVEGDPVRAAFERGVEDPIRQVRRAALAAGSARPGLLPAAPVARILLEDEDWENRVLAAQILGASGDPEAYAPLDEATLDGHELVRAAATRARQALTRAGTPRPPAPTPSPSPEGKKSAPGV